MNTQTQANLALHGKTIKAHLSAADRHDQKATDHRTSAALLLIEVKASLGHGQWIPWLQEHGISPRTARQLMQEHADPAAEEKRKTYDREFRRRERAEQNGTTRAVFNQPHRPFQARYEDHQAPKAARPEPAEVKRLGHARLKQAIDQLTDEQVDLVLKFINEL